MTGIHVRGLQVLTVYVSDMTESVNFYTTVLGFKKSGEMPPGVTLTSGELMLYLEPGRKAKNAHREKLSEISPCFDVESVREAWDAAVLLGATAVQEYTEYTREFAMFKIADPDGNVIELAGNP